MKEVNAVYKVQSRYKEKYYIEPMGLLLVFGVRCQFYKEHTSLDEQKKLKLWNKIKFKAK